MNDIRDALTRAAEGSGTAPLALDQVRGRARRIRRRRTAAALAGTVAAVAAVAGLGVALTPSGSGSDSLPPATGAPSPTAPASSAAPQPRRVVLRADAAGTGAAEPETAFWQDGMLHTPAGAVATPQELRQVAAYGAGWAGRGADGTVYQLSADGDVVWHSPPAGPDGAASLAVSADASVLAWTEPSDDGSGTLVMAKGLDDARPAQVGRLAAEAVQVVGVTGSRSCDPGRMAAGGDVDCAVVVDVLGMTTPFAGYEGAVSVPAGGEPRRITGVRRVSDVAPGLMTGVTRQREDGSVCSVVLRADGDPAWPSTCEHSLEDLSPTGATVIAKPSYGDGLGFTRFSILDSATGAELATFSTPADAFVADVAWETETTLLAEVYDNGWALLRLSVDGAVTRVGAGRIAGEREVPPIVLAHP